MAEKTSDAEDRMLEALFRSEPIADDGFSKRVIARIRRRIWVNRLALPLATLIGAAFAVKPAAEIMSSLLPLLDMMPLGGLIPADLMSAPMQFLPQLQNLVLGGMLLVAAISLFKALEE